MLKRLLILMFITHLAVAMNSMVDFPQRHTRSNSGSQILAPVPYASCQPTDNRPKKEEKPETSPRNIIETGRMVITLTMGRLFSGLPQ